MSEEKFISDEELKEQIMEMLKEDAEDKKPPTMLDAVQILDALLSVPELNHDEISPVTITNIISAKIFIRDVINYANELEDKRKQAEHDAEPDAVVMEVRFEEEKPTSLEDIVKQLQGG